MQIEPFFAECLKLSDGTVVSVEFLYQAFKVRLLAERELTQPLAEHVANHYNGPVAW